MKVLAFAIPVAALIALWVYAWRRSELKFRITDDVLHLESWILGVIPFRMKIPLGSIVMFKLLDGPWALIREPGRVHAASWPRGIGRIRRRGVLIVRSSGGAPLVIAFTGSDEELLKALHEKTGSEAGARRRSEPVISSEASS